MIAEKALVRPIAQAGEQEAQDVAARRAEQRGRAAFRAGKHGQADQAKQDIQQDGQRTLLPAEDDQDHENAESLQRERHRRGDGDQGADDQ